MPPAGRTSCTGWPRTRWSAPSWHCTSCIRSRCTTAPRTRSHSPAQARVARRGHRAARARRRRRGARPGDRLRLRRGHGQATWSSRRSPTWPRTPPGSRSSRPRPDRRCCRSGSAPGRGSDAGLAAFPARAGPRRPSEKCELCSKPVAGEHPHLVDPAERRMLCACPAVRAAVRRAGTQVPAGAGPVPVRPGLHAVRRALGRAADPGRDGVLPAQLRRGPVIACYPEPGRGDRERAGARRRGRTGIGACRLAGGAGVRRRGAADPPRRRRARPGTARSACSSRSTPATGWSAWSGCTGRASTAGSRRGTRSTRSSPSCGSRRLARAQRLLRFACQPAARAARSLRCAVRRTGVQPEPALGPSLLLTGIRSSRASRSRSR